MSGDTIKTSYTSIEEQKQECKNRVTEFIATALGVRKTADILMDSHHGTAADTYSAVVSTLTEDQKRWYQEIMAALDSRLSDWSNMTLASEQRGAAAAEKLS